MNALLNKLGIDETYTKPVKKPSHYNHFKEMVPPMEDWNIMIDLVEMPVTKDKFKYLLVVTDLANRDFDIEPLKTKTSKNVLDNLLKIFKRQYIKMPKYSICSDDGTEFKAEFHKFFFNKNIYHKVAMPDRHTQQAPVERLNKDLVRLFNGYMNAVEEKTEEPYNEWTDIVDEVRKELNKIRHLDNTFKKVTDAPFVEMKVDFDEVEPKYKVGDIVYYQSNAPLNALMKIQPTKTFRVADYRWMKVPKKIISIQKRNDKFVPYRYMLEGMRNVSFMDNQLKLAPSNEKDTKHIVYKIIGKKKMKGRVNYLVWWKKEKKEQATYEPRMKLIEDGLINMIKEFDKSNK